MLLYKNTENEKFKEAFYSQMDKVSDNNIRRLCYMMAVEAQSFVSTYPQKGEIINAANDIVASFLDEFEKYFLHLKVSRNNKVLTGSN